MIIRIAISSIVIVFLVVGGLVYLVAQNHERLESTQVFESTSPTEEAEFQFEIVDTQAKRTRGLSGRRDVPENYGMLFVFEEKGRYGFWMKDMYVSIDMIWLSDEGKVLGIDEAVSPGTYPSIFYPPEPVRYVLETRAKEARAQGWEVGSVIPLPR